MKGVELRGRTCIPLFPFPRWAPHLPGPATAPGSQTLREGGPRAGAVHTVRELKLLGNPRQGLLIPTALGGWTEISSTVPFPQGLSPTSCPQSPAGSGSGAREEQHSRNTNSKILIYCRLFSGVEIPVFPILINRHLLKKKNLQCLISHKVLSHKNRFTVFPVFMQRTVVFW